MMVGQSHAEDEALVTPKKAAKILGVDPKTVSRYAIDGIIPESAVRRTAGGHRRFVESFIRAMRDGQPDPAAA